MLDLDKYLDNSVEMQIGGEVLHVLQPTIGMVDKIDRIEDGMNGKNVREKRVEVVLLMLNHNKEKREFCKEELYGWTMEALVKVITEMSLLRYEAEKDPN